MDTVGMSPLTLNLTPHTGKHCHLTSGVSQVPCLELMGETMRKKQLQGEVKIHAKLAFADATYPKGDSLPEYGISFYYIHKDCHILVKNI